MSYEDYDNSDFAKAMQEFKAQNPVQEETKEKCSHPASISHCGWEICVSCGLYLRRAKDLFQNDEYEYHDRILFRNTKFQDTTPEEIKAMENILHEKMTQVGVPLSHLDNILTKCKKYILPNEERGKGKGPLRISVRIKSLCAVMLWEKVKELKIKMSMVKFSERQINDF